MHSNVQIIAVTGGKGGVGKTNIAINLAIGLSKLERSVMLVDADLGLANVDVLLGISTQRNLSHVLDGSANFDEIVVNGPEGIYIVPAASGLSQVTQQSEAAHAAIVLGFEKLGQPVDTLIIDTAAGISDDVVNFVRAAQEVIIVVCDEPTSITDAYALMKVLYLDYQYSCFHVVANRVANEAQGAMVFGKLQAVCNRFLAVDLNFMGVIPEDKHVQQAVRKQQPFLMAFPGEPASKAIMQLAKKITKLTVADPKHASIDEFARKILAEVDDRV